ncbi:MAG: ABC transporter ATP-binding protein [Acidobacteria bacterium]|nr:ABC transporter ATP-binding protein [Acidobacteriota bacterium]
MSVAVRCAGLHKRYDNKVDAVRGLDLEVEQGECFGLLGPNGAGKTTTIEIIEGLLSATAGEVEVFGKRWGRDDDELRELLGICLQETRLSEKLKVRETLELFASFYRRPADPARVMREVELTEKAEAWVGKLSGGQRQRLAVACSLVGDPRLLFLDEPTTGLDPQSRRQLWDIVRKFKRQGGTVLLTTHYMDEAERLCDRVAIIDHGRIIALGTPRELIHSLGAEHIVEFTLADPAAFPDLGGDGLAAVPTVLSVRQEDGLYALTVGEPHRALPALFDWLEGRGIELARLSTRHASLEDVFVKLTGRHLRDE